MSSSSLVICGTGHRPKSLGFGYNSNDEKVIEIKNNIKKILEEEKPDKIISGMALGFDTWLAEVAIESKIDLIAAIPFKGQDGIWKESSQKIYKDILKKAKEIYICDVYDGKNLEDMQPLIYMQYLEEPVDIMKDYGIIANAMQRRNKWMVDNADIVLALWNGSKGGTANCVKYATKKKKRIINIWEKK